ncbi:MAG: DUF2804 domain-containing protein [Treponema sp.]|nr:DUF2804 domain-containing protein [Treponema sp.]
MPPNEIQEPLPLLDDLGQPLNFGWAKHAFHHYEPSLLYAPRFRISESDRYIIYSPTHMIVFEIRNDGWLGHMGISVISLRDKKRSTQTFKKMLPLGSFEMPNTSAAGNVRWKQKKMHLDFICMESGARIIKTDIPKFGRNRSLRGALVLTEFKESESLATHQPYRNEKNAFRYSCCSPWFFVEGVIQFGSSEIIFTRGNAWGILDWNRSARPKADIRYWAAACGQSHGSQLSFCAGYSWTDSSYGTENAFFIDGKMFKLDQITFHIPLSNWLSPWRFTSNDNRLEMTFTPHQERTDRRNLLLYSSTRRQVCGSFSGKIQLDDGIIIEFHNLTGFAERSKMRY